MQLRQGYQGEWQWAVLVSGLAGVSRATLQVRAPAVANLDFFACRAGIWVLRLSSQARGLVRLLWGDKAVGCAGHCSVFGGAESGGWVMLLCSVNHNRCSGVVTAAGAPT